MSTQVLRFHPFTVSFLATRRAHRVTNLTRALRLATSTRQMKRLIRQFSLTR